MAEAITRIKKMEFTDEEIKERDLDDVLTSVGENKDAILKGITLLRTLDDNGMLDLVDALIKQRKAAMENVFTELNKSQYTGVLENLSKLVFLLGDLDVEKLGEFTQKVNQGMTETSVSDPDEKASIMGLMKALKDPEINRSVTMILQFLRGMGRES